MTPKPTDKDKKPKATSDADAADGPRRSMRTRAARKRSTRTVAEAKDKTATGAKKTARKTASGAAKTSSTTAKKATAKSTKKPVRKTTRRRTARKPAAADEMPTSGRRETASMSRTAAPAAGSERPQAGPLSGRARFEDTEDPHALGIGSRVVPPVMAYEDEGPPSEHPGPPGTGSFDLTQEEVEAQIRALEARLDGMIRRAGGRHDEESEPPPSIREQVGSAARAVVDRLASPLPIERPGTDDGGVVDTVRELASSDYYIRQWGRIGMRNRSEEVDDFGLDPTYEKRLRPLFDFLYERYFRTETRGIDRIPPEGRCLIVANHSGTVPFDGVMLRTAVRLEHPAAREMRWLAEDFIYYLPFMGAFMNRIGAVRACQENAERLLKQGRLVGVFPEGVKGVGKLFRDRYRLQRFGRGGYIRLCLRTQTPLVPCAIVGAEETNPMLYRVEYLSRAFGLPYIPVTPIFPWLGPLGLLPAPTKWRIRFGEPIRFNEYGPEAADDHVLVGRLSEQVRTTIQRMLDSALRERQSVWFG